MTVRSRRVWGPTKVTTTNYTLVYTVPANRTLVLRSVTFYNGTGADNPFILACNGSDIDHVVLREVILSARTSPALAQSGLNSGMPKSLVAQELIFNPGDTLYVQCTTAGYVTAGFGSLLDGAPS